MRRGRPRPTTLTITITGTNDGPVAVADTNAGDAVARPGLQSGGNTPIAGDPTASGNVLANDTDVDTGDGGSDRAAAVGGVGRQRWRPGWPAPTAVRRRSAQADGSYTYTLDDTNARRQALAPGADRDRRVQLHGDRRSAARPRPTTLTITITGTNDGPVAVADTNAATRSSRPAVQSRRQHAGAGDATASGNVLANDTDVDTGTADQTVAAVQRRGRPTSATVVAGTYGFGDDRSMPTAATPTRSTTADAADAGAAQAAQTADRRVQLHGDRPARRDLDRER